MIVKPKVCIGMVIAGLAGFYICVRTLPVVADRHSGWITVAWVLGMLVSMVATGGGIGLHLRQRDEAARLSQRSGRYYG